MTPPATCTPRAAAHKTALAGPRHPRATNTNYYYSYYDYYYSYYNYY